MGGNALGDVALAAHEEFASPSAQHTCHQFRQGMHGRGIKHEADVGIASLQLIRPVLLGDHAPAHTDDHLGIRFLQVFILTDDGQRFFLRVLPHGTGVHQNQFGLGGIVGDGISHQACKSCDPLAVCLILLTAEGLHKALGRILACASVLCMDSRYLLRKAELPIYLLPGKFPGSSVFCLDFFHQTASVWKRNSTSAQGECPGGNRTVPRV